MSKFEYKDYWFNYVLDADPQKIKDLIKEDQISSQGLDIHLDIYDDKEKSLDKTVIFLHGTSVYSRFYAEWLYNLHKKGFRIVAPDMPGHGMSGGKRGHFTMKMFNQTVYDVNSWVIEKYGTDNNCVMGSSLGGINALYSVAYDDRLKGAVSHNAALFNEKAYKKIIDIKGVLKILMYLVPVVVKIAPKLRVSVWLYLDFRKLAKTERLLDRVDLVINDERLADKYSTKAIRTQMKDPMAKPIEKIEAPVMIINGDEDYLFTVEYMTELYDRLTCKNKSLEILKGASHLIFQENIPEALKRVVPWLNKIL